MSVLYETYLQGFRGTMHEVDALASEAVVRRIFQLRDERRTLLLAHNYMVPLIFALSDPGARGDSLALARFAAAADNPVILLNGVLFMAETAKILNPGKKVLIASKLAGCSLADPIRAAQVLQIRAEHPGAPVVTYVNSYADVKAESDVCCTSANALAIIKRVAREWDTRKVIFLPDTLMGKNLQEELDHGGAGVDLIYPGKRNSLPEGKCEVHEQFTVEDLRTIRRQYAIPKGHPRRAILAHWECTPEVVAEADFHGSTSQMGRYIGERGLERVYLATECEMAANLQQEHRQVDFVRACLVFCKHMRQITLERILHALETEDAAQHEVTLEERLRQRALVPIQRMLEYSA